MSGALLLMMLALADPPADVLEFFRTTVESLLDNDAREFMANFDPNMPGYAKLRDEIDGLLASGAVGSTIEIVSDEGDDRKRALELDWLLEIEGKQPKRGILKCRIERQGKKWKITSLDPIEFFKD